MGERRIPGWLSGVIGVGVLLDELGQLLARYLAVPGVEPVGDAEPVELGLLHARQLQKILTHALGQLHQLAVRQLPGLQRVKREVDVIVFIVEERAGNAARQPGGLVRARSSMHLQTLSAPAGS